MTLENNLKGYSHSKAFGDLISRGNFDEAVWSAGVERGRVITSKEESENGAGG
jgi:hypothetical protein